MKPNKRQDDDATIPGSMEMAWACDQSVACRAQAELVETLARLVLDSVAKGEQARDGTDAKTNCRHRHSHMGPRGVE
jgi:hypothetical protein